MKAEYDSFKISKMTDDEKKNAQAKAKDQEFTALKMQLNEMTAKSIFSNAGIKEDDYDEYDDLLKLVVKEDTDATKASAEAICNVLAKQKEATKKAVENKIIKNTPKPPAGNDGDKGSANELEQYQELLKEATERNDFVKMAYYTRLVQEAQLKNKK